MTKVMQAPGVLLAVCEIPSKCQVLDDVQINKEVGKTLLEGQWDPAKCLEAVSVSQAHEQV